VIRAGWLPALSTLVNSRYLGVTLRSLPLVKLVNEREEHPCSGERIIEQRKKGA
jgi:hypothetical protein